MRYATDLSKVNGEHPGVELHSGGKQLQKRSTREVGKQLVKGHSMRAGCGSDRNRY